MKAAAAALRMRSELQFELECEFGSKPQCVRKVAASTCLRAVAVAKYCYYKAAGANVLAYYRGFDYCSTQLG